MTDGPYAEFEQRVRRLGNLGQAEEVLRWDQEVMMPEGGTPARSQQLSVLSGIKHELLTDDQLTTLLAELATADLPPQKNATVREIKRRHDRAVAVPTELIEEISETTSEAVSVWETARKEDDFEAFAPILDELVELKREYANHVDPDRDPYAVLFEEYEPYLGLDTAETILSQLRDELVPLLDAIAASDTELDQPFEGTFEVERQEEVARTALDVLGYDWEHGRLDTSAHPFSTGNVYDARITTRFDETEPLDSLLSTIHEFGHATYTRGLPDDEYGTPLGESRDLVVHESQSRFWENHVGRTHAFWTGFLPTFTEQFPELADLTVGEIYQAINQIYPDNTIRVEADELTYHLHIILRFEIERDLISGDLTVSDIPTVWNDKMENYLGIRPETDAAGCLQDIHWSHGAFGYFPTYSLGSVLAAQLHHHAAAAIDNVDELIQNGEFNPIHDWLTDQIHRHGCRYTTPALIETATGEAFTADYFLDYVDAKFTELYEL